MLLTVWATISRVRSFAGEEARDLVAEIPLRLAFKAEVTAAALGTPRRAPARRAIEVTEIMFHKGFWSN